LCPRCRLDLPFCLCASIPRVDVRTAFVIVRHVKEGLKRTNTARIAALAIPDCEILEHGALGAVVEAGRLDRPGTWLLYTGGPPADPAGPKPDRLVVLDGTWAQARRMLHRLPAIQQLPRLTLPPPSSVHARRLRRAPAPHAMATLEAIAHAVAFLEGVEAAEPLHRLYAAFVERNVRSAKHGGRRPIGGT
ncbi:MAG: DTW domain-containing protein, partial [Planctomycetes bacterium]|nr:DTW domain-containing protein [Planctomycetota bacterium]